MRVELCPEINCARCDREEARHRVTGLSDPTFNEVLCCECIKDWGMQCACEKKERPRMAKVYCGKCQFYELHIFWLEIGGDEHRCTTRYSVKDTPTGEVKVYADCLTKNKDNDCLGFEPKRKRKWWHFRDWEHRWI